MLKKILTLSAVVASITISAQVHAAAASLSSSSTMITPANCPALDNNITVQMSKDVVGAFNCGQTSFVAATCHISGTNKPNTVDAQYDNSGNILPEYTGCDASGKNCTFNGRTGFRGSSAGGQVGAVPLGDSPCNTTSIKTLTPDNMLYSDNGTSESTQP